MTAPSTLTFRTLRLATIALGLACFHAYAVAGPGGSGRVATVARTGGGGNSRITTYTSRSGATRAGVETFAGARVRVARSAGAAGARRSTPSRGTSDVAQAVARTEKRMTNNRAAPVARLPRSEPVQPTVSDPVLQAALARPEARRTDGMRNVFALRTAPTVAELIADSATAGAPPAGGNSH